MWFIARRKSVHFGPARVWTGHSRTTTVADHRVQFAKRSGSDGLGEEISERHFAGQHSREHASPGARPHHVGSPYDKDNAEWILSKFKEWGFDAKIETFNVLFPTPKDRLVEMLQPTKFQAKMQEPVLAIDPTTDQTDEQLPTYNAYSIDGDVTAPLVYVNYGSREDYEQLDRLGISVKGAIVIARYGDGWRGIKPKVAAEHGAIGCIIYSDPKGDGYYRGDDYPAGGWRPREGVQRGSVMDTDYPGDPLTPGVAATADAKRLAIKEAKTITRIPVLPISYADALPLLSALKGPVAPEGWRGALAITYHIGPGPAQVHLKVASNWDIKPIYDVIGTLRGTDGGQQWVLRGNHHDAWVNGADDPISGQAAMLEEARMLGELHRQGWNPSAPSSIAHGMAKSPGCWAQSNGWKTHLNELQTHAVAYINSDSNERGFLLRGRDSGFAELSSAASRATFRIRKLTPPYFSARISLALPEPKTPKSAATCANAATFWSSALGDGSDYTAFQDFAGISTLSVGFGGEDDGDQYHSIYDDFYWYTHFADTDFAYGRALAQTAGTAMMRLADADLHARGLRSPGRGHCEIRGRTGEAAQRQAGRIYRAQPGAAGRRFYSHRRSAQNLGAASG